MSLFSGILGNVVGSVFGSNPRGSQNNMLGEVLGDLGGGVPIQSGMLLAGALRFLQANGGLDGTLAKLRQGGLGAQADSWVGAGPNLPISPSELERALGSAGAHPLGGQIALSPTEAGSAMSQILPELVNQLTPGGQLPANHADLIAKGLAMLSHAGA